MKFEDIIVGKTYKTPNDRHRKIVYKGEGYVVAELDSLVYPTVYQANSLEKNPYENWTEVREKEKVYVFSYRYKSTSHLIYTNGYNNKQQATAVHGNYTSSSSISWVSEVKEVEYQTPVDV